jgi:hypothetical protein
MQLNGSENTAKIAIVVGSNMVEAMNQPLGLSSDLLGVVIEGSRGQGPQGLAPISHDVA